LRLPPGTTTKFLVDDKNPTGYAQILDELANGSVTRTYAYGLQRISEHQLVGSTWTPSFCGFDGHGNVRFLANSAGTITDTYTFDAFGAQIASTGTTSNPYLYSGEHFDSALNLYHLRARYYNMLTGRFMSMDPWQHKSCRSKSPLWSNAYAYVSDNPVNKFDPTGRAEVAVEYAIDLRDVLLVALGRILAYERALHKQLGSCDLLREEWVPGKGVRCRYDCHDLGERCIDFPDAKIGVNHCPFDASPELLTPCEDLPKLE